MSDRHERYVSPEGNTVDCIAVSMGKKESFACVTVQMDAARESFKSQIWYAEDFSSDELEEKWDKPGWIVSMWMSPSDKIYAITSRNALISGLPDSLEEQPFWKSELNRVRGFAENDIYVLGRGGLVLHSNGEVWQEISIPDTDRLYDIAKTEDGRLFVSGRSGAFFERTENGWDRIETSTNAELYGVLAGSDGWVYLCGQAGTCARYKDGELELLSANPERNYRTIAEWQNEVYFGSGGTGIERLEDTELVAFEKEMFSYALDGNRHYLATAGLTEVGRWDGDDWDYEEFE